MAARELWYAIPGPMPNIGSKFGRCATWIGASGEQTFLKIDESLINATNLTCASVAANARHILLLPTACHDEATSFKSLAISRNDGFCR
jgi:E3 ubiquitin-protein ligase MYCBP2